MTQTVFVTGASGFIGKSLIQHLAASKDVSIKVLTRKPVPEFASLSRPPQQVIGDLLKPETYRDGLTGCDTVVHLAAVTGRAAPAEYRRGNVDGTAMLLEACKTAGVRRFLYMSTIAAGYPDKSYYSYAATKAEAENLVKQSGIEFAIVRPTIVLGEKSPIWNTLLKIAKLPFIPLFEGRQPVQAQPVHVDDIVRGIALVLDSGRFEGATLELGGPRPLPFREFLVLTQTAVRGSPGKIVRVPLWPVRTMLALMEPVLRPLMPVTAGQLAIFANDSTAAENWLLAQLRTGMSDPEETIATLADSAGSDRHDGTGAQPPQRPSRPMTDEARRGLDAECRMFSGYLLGAAPSSYVLDHYARAAYAHGLAFDEDFTCLDHVTLRLARSGRLLARCADAYCAFFHRRGALRRKLIVLAAVLEHVAPTSEAFDRTEQRSVARMTISLMAYGFISALSLLFGSLILIPATALCWVASRSQAADATVRPAQ